MLTVFMVFSSACVSHAQQSSFADLNEAQNMIESSLDFVRQQKESEGLLSLSPFFPINPIALEQIFKELAGGHQQAVETLGNSLGFIFAGTRQVKSVLAEITYIERLEKSGLRWRFYLYKSTDRWTFHSIQMDGNIPAALEQWGEKV